MNDTFYQVKFDEPTDLLDASLRNKITAVNEQMITASFLNHNATEVHLSPNVEVMRFSLLGSDKMGSLLKIETTQYTETMDELNWAVLTLPVVEYTDNYVSEWTFAVWKRLIVHQQALKVKYADIENF